MRIPLGNEVNRRAWFLFYVPDKTGEWELRVWWSTFGPPQTAAHAALRGLLLLRRLDTVRRDSTAVSQFFPWVRQTHTETIAYPPVPVPPGGVWPRVELLVCQNCSSQTASVVLQGSNRPSRMGYRARSTALFIPTAL
jgi:hypothetical protein